MLVEEARNNFDELQQQNLYQKKEETLYGKCSASWVRGNFK